MSEEQPKKRTIEVDEEFLEQLYGLVGKIPPGEKNINVDLLKDLILDIKRKIDVSYNVDEPFTAPAGNGEYICTIRLKVEVEIEREGKKANIRLVTEGAFVLDQNDKETLKTMTSINGSAALYSIARGIIASVSGQMCEGGGIIIPMLNVYEMNKELQK